MRKVRIDNPRYPHHIRIVRKLVSDWLEDERQEKEVMVYDGPGRSYTDTTTTGDHKVDTNKRKASIPVRFDMWKEPSVYVYEDTAVITVGAIPMSGDLLYVEKGNITEEWQVRDFEPDNNRSVVYGDMNRNFNMD